MQQWEKDLNTINDVIETWMTVQRKWMYLESIFASDDIKMQLPEEAKKFGRTDTAYKKIMESVNHSSNVLHNAVKADGGSRLADLKNISLDLDKCQKSLSNYLETKQMAFPRFYFISNDDLLQILSVGSDPNAVQDDFEKLFDAINRVSFDEQDRKMIVEITQIMGGCNENIQLVEPVKAEGNIEDWLVKLEKSMQASVRSICKKGA